MILLFKSSRLLRVYKRLCFLLQADTDITGKPSYELVLLCTEWHHRMSSGKVTGDAGIDFWGLGLCFGGCFVIQARDEDISVHTQGKPSFIYSWANAYSVPLLQSVMFQHDWGTWSTKNSRKCSFRELGGIRISRQSIVYAELSVMPAHIGQGHGNEYWSPHYRLKQGGEVVLLLIHLQNQQSPCQQELC